MENYQFTKQGSKRGRKEQWNNKRAKKKKKKKDVISKPLPINNYLNVNQKA